MFKLHGILNLSGLLLFSIFAPESNQEFFLTFPNPQQRVESTRHNIELISHIKLERERAHLVTQHCAPLLNKLIIFCKFPIITYNNNYCHTAPPPQIKIKSDQPGKTLLAHSENNRQIQKTPKKGFFKFTLCLLRDDKLYPKDLFEALLLFRCCCTFESVMIFYLFFCFQENLVDK